MCAARPPCRNTLEAPGSRPGIARESYDDHAAIPGQVNARAPCHTGTAPRRPRTSASTAGAWTRAATRENHVLAARCQRISAMQQVLHVLHVQRRAQRAVQNQQNNEQSRTRFELVTLRSAVAYSTTELSGHRHSGRYGGVTMGRDLLMYVSIFRPKNAPLALQAAERRSTAACSLCVTLCHLAAVSWQSASILPILHAAETVQKPRTPAPPDQ